MSLKRCEKGHFYNGNKYRECPKCLSARGAGGEDPATAALGAGTDRTVSMAAGNMGARYVQQEDPVTIPMPHIQQEEDSVTVPLMAKPPKPEASAANPGKPEMEAPAARSPRPEPEKAAFPEPEPERPHNTPLQAAVSRAAGSDDDGKTISIYKSKKGIDPVTGWLVCIEGDDFGASFTIKSGRNFIGRSHDMDIVLHGDNSISRERHAIIIYEPKRREFIAQAGESRELFYLNEEVVLSPVHLNQYDILTIGNTRLMFFPCCGENFSWDDLANDGE